IVDDVATTGSSIIKAINVVESHKCEIKKVICIVDREEGAKEEIEKKGYKLEAIFTKGELLNIKKNGLGKN
ncbi:MAG: phosphoribosyltransferase family protein, partial [bacterium]|nr:phosphoribosyltransferase family protein [bacterium]MDW8164279.1 phosphoribosyltransferase family protein [Candidatus Omnitrophota bacterium]